MPAAYKNPQDYSDEIGAREYTAHGAVMICEYMRSFSPDGGAAIDTIEGATVYKIMMGL